MKKLQAAMRDRAAQTWRHRKVCYRVGSYFKGCHHCGEVVWVETNSGRLVKRYKSGYQVFRAYTPNWTKWTYWCYECGSKDLDCWEGAEDIGLPAIAGTRNAVSLLKQDRRRMFAAEKAQYSLRKEEVGVEGRLPAPTFKEEIGRIEAQLQKLIEQIKGRK